MTSYMVRLKGGLVARLDIRVKLTTSNRSRVIRRVHFVWNEQTNEHQTEQKPMACRLGTKLTLSVHSLVLPFHDLRGLPLRRPRFTVPCSLLFGIVSRRQIWPIHDSLQRLMVDNELSCSPARTFTCRQIQLFVLRSRYDNDKHGNPFYKTGIPYISSLATSCKSDRYIVNQCESPSS